ncbi:hypothetical protein DUI87_20957 [Hirundo rustica rustica]|uniref:HSF-type DNA-binding domain-containing protein n=1 Tax=Hirundo rustica rustica TaxID=333673 RepID=A0A3M0JNL7_HIRRU|nr:hypothetical protein DUI87_20957 [Hirundo rustica rustica]
MVTQAKNAAWGQSPALLPEPALARAVKCRAGPAPGPRKSQRCAAAPAPRARKEERASDERGTSRERERGRAGSASERPAEQGARGAERPPQAACRRRSRGRCAPSVVAKAAMDAMAQLPLPAGLGAGTFPAKLWSLVNDPRVRSLRWDSEARGLLVDRSLFERELLRPGGAQGPAPHAFRATQFSSFVHQLYRYGFRKVPGRDGAAAPGDAGAWLHYRNPWFRRDRPDLLLRIRRRSAANTQQPAAGPEGRRRPPCGSQQLPGPRPLPDERHGRARFQPLPRERPPLARRPLCSFHLLHRERPGPARREGPSRFQELYGERPLPAERELLRVPPCHFQGFHGEQLLPPRWEGPRSRMQELYGEQPPPLDRDLLWMQPCSFQQLHREQQPPASNPPAAAGTSAPHAPAGSAGCAASTACSSAQNAPAQEESPALDLGLEIEKMIHEIRNSLPVKAPSAQGNINVAPESPGEDPMNRAAAEEVSPGTESCGNNSPEPEEPVSPE